MGKESTCLLSGVSIGKMYLRNRIVMPAIVTNFAKPDGNVTQRMIDYYVERAKGGAGLIITEGAYPDISGKRFAYMLGAEEQHKPGLRLLTDSVHKAGGKIALQLLHAGRRALYEYSHCQPLGPGSVPAPGCEIPRSMTQEDIDRICESYVGAIVRAKQTGFDAAEVHIAHGYLLNQFASPAINKRNDKYGGSTENRARLSTDIIKRAKELVGPDFPIICKLNGSDYVDGGLVPDESAKLAVLLEKAGADAISFSGGLSYSAEMVIQPAAVSEACHLNAAEVVSAAVSVPVGVVGRIQNAKLAESVIESGKCAFICMGRALLADPDLPEKLRKGMAEQIRPCIVCMKGCCERESNHLPITCAVNARTGREADWQIKAASTPKKLAVIGAGFAGMESARVLAERGYAVTLYEKCNRLGGQGFLAALPPHKADIAGLIRWFARELERLNVEMRLGTEINEENLPDADFIIISSGSVTSFPKSLKTETVEGKKTAPIVDAMQILENDVSGKNIVVIGGGLVGCETGEKLAQSNKVTMVEMMPGFARDMESKGRKVLLDELQERGVNMVSSAEFLKLKGDSVYLNRSGVIEQISNVDIVVWATGRKSVNGLEKVMREKGVPFAIVGDASSPRHILGAIHDAFNLCTEL